MSKLRRSGAVLAIVLAAGLPAMIGVARAETTPAMPQGRALHQLDRAEHDLVRGHRMAAEVRLERAESSLLKQRSAIEGKPDSGQRVAALNHAVAAIGEARMAAQHRNLQQAEQKATEASQVLRGI